MGIFPRGSASKDNGHRQAKTSPASRARIERPSKIMKVRAVGLYASHGWPLI